MHRSKQTFFQFLVILSGLVMACVVILLCSDEPAVALKFFFTGPFSSVYFFGDMLAKAVPLIITGLAATVSFSASVWNLGTEGMVYFGMLTGTLAAYFLRGWPAPLAMPLMFLAAMLGGVIPSAICNLLKNKFNVSIMMSSLMVANMIFYLVIMIVEGPFRDISSGQGVTSYAVSENFRFPLLLEKSDLNSSLFLALALVALVYFGIRRSRLGYEITMTGRNPSFAKYGGINTVAVASAAMLISGGLAGVGGMTYVMSTSFRLRNQLPGIGWDGVSIAMIARNNPILVVLVALFFAFLEKGAESAALFADITPDMAQIIQGAILLLVTSDRLIEALMRDRKKAVRRLGEAGV
ncbi:MAG: ABC transporter permease [Bacillota bacterium]